MTDTSLSRNFRTRCESINLIATVSLCPTAPNSTLRRVARKGAATNLPAQDLPTKKRSDCGPANVSAVHGLRVATIDHAKNALDQENYELGISILDAQDPEHRDLLSKLESKRFSQRRLAWFSKIAAATALIAVLTVAVVTVSKNRQLDQQRQDAVVARNDAVEARNDAVGAQQTALNEAERAKAAELQARKSRDAALMAKVVSRRAEVAARHEKRNAEEAAYSSDIGLAAESIRRNAFNKATSILEGLRSVADSDSDSIKSKLRHIEWGILQDASTPGPVEDLLPGPASRSGREFNRRRGLRGRNRRRKALCMAFQISWRPRPRADHHSMRYQFTRHRGVGGRTIRCGGGRNAT